MRKKRIKYVDFRVKRAFYNAICHIVKVRKTLATSAFFEFLTKFSTYGGKLFLQVGKFTCFSSGKEKLISGLELAYERLHLVLKACIHFHIVFDNVD